MNSPVELDAVDRAATLNSSCTHCGLPVRAARRRPHGGRPSDEPRFCCVGCRIAFAAAGDAGAHGSLEARLALAAFLAMGVMTFSLVLYGETVYAPAEDNVLRLVRNLGRYALAILSLPVILLLGAPLLRGAWDDLWNRRVRMDGLIVLAVSAAWILSTFNTLTGGGEVYYDTATMVLVLVTLGRRLEAGARTRGRDAAAALAECLPEVAHRLRPVIAPSFDKEDEAAETVPPDQLVQGDRVHVLPGEAIPADLRVTCGEGSVRAAHLTGEETPIRVTAGDEIPAGALNGTSLLTGVVVRPAQEGALGRIRALLDEPLPATRTVRLADRLAGTLAIVAVVLAIVGGVRSTWLLGAATGLETALSVLLVACPCALGLATPLAFRAQRASLARRGILVRDPVALEVAGSIDVALLDKTGTLTTPQLVTEAESTERIDSQRMRTLVAHSGHALAASVGSGRQVSPPQDLRVIPGAGVVGTFDGTLCRAGSPDWMDQAGLEWSNAASRDRERWAATEATLVAYAEGDRVRAVGAVRHALRPGTVPAVRALIAQGLRVELCSGDRPAAVQALADELGVTGVGGRTPQQKLERLRELRAMGHVVLFAGDGVNDAPALRAADVSVAPLDATAAASSQAQVDVIGERLDALPALIEGARQLRRVVRGNLFWTLSYNGVALALAVTGQLHPLVAAVAMIISSAVVSARSYRLLGDRQIENRQVEDSSVVDTRLQATRRGDKLTSSSTPPPATQPVAT